MGALIDFQTALYLALSTDSTLLGLIGNAKHIADWPTPKTPYPLVTIGEDSQSQWGMKSETKNFRVSAMIHVWSDRRGWEQAKQIVDQLDVILLDGQLQLAGSSSQTIIGKGTRPDDLVMLPGDDKGKIRHIVARYIFWLSC